MRKPARARRLPARPTLPAGGAGSDDPRADIPDPRRVRRPARAGTWSKDGWAARPRRFADRLQRQRAPPACRISCRRSYSCAGLLERGACGLQGVGDVLLAVRAGDESGFEGARREKHAALQHAVEEALERGDVAGGRLREGFDLLRAEEQTEHPAHAVARDRHARVMRAGLQTIGEQARLAVELLVKTRLA